jgi:hypothetical protein
VITEPAHVMSRDHFEKIAAREVYSEVIADRLVTFNTCILPPAVDWGGEARKRRTMTLAGIAKATGETK